LPLHSVWPNHPMESLLLPTFGVGVTFKSWAIPSRTLVVKNTFISMEEAPCSPVTLARAVTCPAYLPTGTCMVDEASWEAATQVLCHAMAPKLEDVKKPFCKADAGPYLETSPNENACTTLPRSLPDLAIDIAPSAISQEDDPDVFLEICKTASEVSTAADEASADIQNDDRNEERNHNTEAASFATAHASDVCDSAVASGEYGVFYANLNMETCMPSMFHGVYLMPGRTYYVDGQCTNTNQHTCLESPDAP